MFVFFALVCVFAVYLFFSCVFTVNVYLSLLSALLFPSLSLNTDDQTVYALIVVKWRISNCKLRTMKSTLNFVVHINTVVRGYPSFTTNSVLNFLEEKWLKIKLYLMFVCVCVCSCVSAEEKSRQQRRQSKQQQRQRRDDDNFHPYSVVALRTGKWQFYMSFQLFKFSFSHRHPSLSLSRFLLSFSFAIVCSWNNIWFCSHNDMIKERITMTTQHDCWRKIRFGSSQANGKNIEYSKRLFDGTFVSVEKKSYWMSTDSKYHISFPRKASIFDKKWEGLYHLLESLRVLATTVAHYKFIVLAQWQTLVYSLWMTF